MLRRAWYLCLTGGSLLWLMAQQPPAKEPPQDLLKTNTPQFNATVKEMQLPVLVRDRNRELVSGLQPNQFRLFDNGKEQNLTSVDISYTPISLVVAIQANAAVDKILPQINRVGVMLKPILLGEQGEAAVIAFDSRVRLMQPFTGDADNIGAAIKNIRAGSTRSYLLDAVEQSAALLSHRDPKRQRILLVIGEKRDDGGRARLRETLQKLQLANITTHWVEMSHIIATLTKAPPTPRPDPQPPAMHPMPGGVPATPTTVDQAYGTNGARAEFLPLMIEILKDVRHIFTASPAELFTKGTGGEQFNFTTQKGLEEALTRISEQLHSQYLITYTPNNKSDGGFHRIEVEVTGHDYKCETKPGYWMSPDFR